MDQTKCCLSECSGCADCKGKCEGKCESKCGKKCSCCHHNMIYILIILVGLDFLLGALGLFSSQTVEIIWPILLIVAGGMKMMGHKCKCC